MDMCVGVAGPHDVRTRSSVCSWKAGRFRIKGPHNHPVRDQLRSAAMSGRRDLSRFVCVAPASM